MGIKTSRIDLAMSEMKAWNEIPEPKPARISANERVLWGVAHEDSIDHSNVAMFCECAECNKRDSSKPLGTENEQSLAYWELGISNN